MKAIWGWVAAGVAAVVAVGAIIYEETKKSSSSNPPLPQQFTLQPGLTYSFVLSCPDKDLTTLFPPVPMPPATAAANILLQGFPVTAESFVISADKHTATLVFTYNGSQPVTIPAIQVSGATGCSVNITPTISVHQGGGGLGGHNFIPPQFVTLQNGQIASASNRPGGGLTITAPGAITGINGAPVRSSSATSNSGVVIVILSGVAGTINVQWNTGTPQGATIQVS